MSDATPSPLRQLFLDGMSHAACTVSIVTTDGPAGRHGVTVSAMSSVSADSAQPSLLVCVHHKSKACEAIQRNGVFCVNVLREDQSDISDTFAGRIKTADGDKFSCGSWVALKTGSPRIVDPLVAFDCRLEQSLKYGSHRIFIGEVEDIFVEEGGHPLIYANRAYGRPARIDRPMAVEPGKDELRIGALITLAPYVVPALVRRLMDERPGLAIRLVEAPQSALVEALKAGECDVALTYGFDLDSSLRKEKVTDIPAYALLPGGHPLGKERRVSLADLAKEPMILLDLPMSRDYFLGLFRAQGLEPRIALSSTNFETVRGLVGQGLGFALLGTKPANNMTYDGMALAVRPLAEGSPDSEIVIASLPKAKETEGVKAFRKAARAHFG